MTPLQWKRLFFRVLIWIFLIALVGFLVVVGSSTWRVYSKGQEAEAMHKTAAKNVDELYERKGNVEESLEKLNTPRGIEEEVRKRYELGKPGEEQIVLVTDPTKEAESGEEKKSLWDVLFGWMRW